MRSSEQSGGFCAGLYHRAALGVRAVASGRVRSAKVGERKPLELLGSPTACKAEEPLSRSLELRLEAGVPSWLIKCYFPPFTPVLRH